MEVPVMTTAATRPGRNGRLAPLEGGAAALVIARAELSRERPPDDVLGRLPHDWGDLAHLAVDAGERGVRDGLAAIEARDPDRAAELRRQLEAAEAGADARP